MVKRSLYILPVHILTNEAPKYYPFCIFWDVLYTSDNEKLQSCRKQTLLYHLVSCITSLWNHWVSSSTNLGYSIVSMMISSFTSLEMGQNKPRLNPNSLSGIDCLDLGMSTILVLDGAAFLQPSLGCNLGVSSAVTCTALTEGDSCGQEGLCTHLSCAPVVPFHQSWCPSDSHPDPSWSPPNGIITILSTFGCSWRPSRSYHWFNIQWYEQ